MHSKSDESDEKLERLEDAYDVAGIERLKNEPCYPWEQVKAELKAKHRRTRAEG